MSKSLLPALGRWKVPLPSCAAMGAQPWGHTVPWCGQRCLSVQAVWFISRPRVRHPSSSHRAFSFSWPPALVEWGGMDPGHWIPGILHPPSLLSPPGCLGAGLLAVWPLLEPLPNGGSPRGAAIRPWASALSCVHLLAWSPPGGSFTCSCFRLGAAVLRLALSRPSQQAPGQPELCSPL